MTAPAKPWEGGPNLRFAVRDDGALYSRGPVVNMPTNQPMARQGVPVRRLAPAGRPPPIPARIGGGGLFRQAEYAGQVPGYGMGSYGGGYGTSSGLYGGIGGYGGYGGGGYGGGAYGGGAYGLHGYGPQGYGMNRIAQQQGITSFENRFIQMAEANSRPAFESIESLVQAFGSVSFMMDSTLQAMYSSFRAVLGVAENFGRLRSLFGQVFQTFAVLRLFQWIYRKLLYYLGIRSDNPGREAVWRQATGQLDPKTRRTFWPVAMFLSLVCGGPFLVWRLLRSINITPPATDSVINTINPRAWITNPETVLPVAVALYDFEAARDNELTLKRAHSVWVAPSHLQTPGSEWLLVTKNWKEAGLVPANFIQIMEHRQVTKPKPANVVVKPAEILTIAEISPEIRDQQDPMSSYPVQDVSRVLDTLPEPQQQQHTPVIPAGPQQADAQANKRTAAPTQQLEVTRTVDLPQPQPTDQPDHMDQSQPTNTPNDNSS